VPATNISPPIQSTLTPRKRATAGARAKVLQTTQDMNSSIFYIIGVIVVIVVILKLIGLW
jgi:hypothetical protein